MTQSSDDSSDRDRQFVSALARGLRILRCFEAGSPALTNQELAERTGLPKPTVSRLTHTLCELGYLIHVAEDGRYQLGAGVLALGYGMLASLDIREYVRPYAEELARSSRVAVAIGIRDGNEVIYLDIWRSPETITIGNTIGSRLPLFTTAIGRAIIGSLPAADFEAAIARITKSRSHATRSTAERLRKARSDLAQRGFCSSFGDWLPDINAVGAPLISLDGRQVYGLTAGAHAFSVQPETLMREVGPQLARIARDLSGPRIDATA